MKKRNESAPEGHFHTIVVSTDGTPFSMRAVEVGFRVAKRDGAKIIVVAVVDTGALLDFADASPGERAKVEKELQYNAEAAIGAAGKLATDRGVDVEVIVRRGRPYIEIVEVAGEAEADLIVMGMRSGVRAARHLVGSVAQRVIEDADCSVLLVR